jgi:hypothetical protein
MKPPHAAGRRPVGRSRRAAFFAFMHPHLAPDGRDVLLAAARAHREAGDLVVAVTAHEPLEPALRADWWVPPDVGHSSALGVVEAIACLGLDAAQCFAYADACAEDVLTIVGNPRVLRCSAEPGAGEGPRRWPLAADPAALLRPPRR